MNVNKKFDRFKQWAGERMGGEAKTNLPEDFKALECEMTLRHDGMERLQKSMVAYVKAMSKRNEAEDKEKNLPVAYLGGTMVSHGDEFEPDSEFGQCLISFGRTNERIARIQENYTADATSSWLESLERSLTQMKEYQAARKKLETRRLAYDTSLGKMQKAKKEDFRVEEELRGQKLKYEESCEEVYRRMQDIKEAEAESVADLGTFLDAELNYYDTCREALLQLRSEWPAGQLQQHANGGRRTGRPRSSMAHSYRERCQPVEEEPQPPTSEPRQSIRSTRTTSAYSRDIPSPESNYHRPAYSRASTFESPTQIRQDVSPAPSQRLSRVTSDGAALHTSRQQLRSVRNNDSYLDADSGIPHSNHSPERMYGDRAISPATSSYAGSVNSRNASSTALSSAVLANKKPPPPPPFKAKKPPPPPPPAKRSLVGGDA
ncbi:hypothetical protein FQN54_007536 [Arachnomyces sp. PD_36]|nr:hypothetical protein FQN54_007536 [Arachnomyces sp. PD_36]